MTRYFFTSVTRISDLRERAFEVEPVPREQWRDGDYVVGEVNSRPNPLIRVELSTGRTIEVMEGSLIIGALARRHATLEMVGDWRLIEDDMILHLLGGGGTLGKVSSKSPFLPNPLAMDYRGHLDVGGRKANMKDYVAILPEIPFTVPVILVIGTSMSAGKTTTARIVIRLLKESELRVVGAKLTGAGRYRDILSMRDAGADEIFDFIDVGLPTTVCSETHFRPALSQLLTRIQKAHPDVVVVEIGASPMEPYNGLLALETIAQNVRCTILCASDPYAVRGLIDAYPINVDIIAGLATNTRAGIELVERLTGIHGLNLLDRVSSWQLRDVLRARLHLMGPNHANRRS